MPFGISPAGEIFQRRLDLAIEGLDEVKTVADDILVIENEATTAEAVKDHDTKLDALLSRFRERRITLNEEKIDLKGNGNIFFYFLV
jgi:cell division GTPase FtsZ